VAETGRNGRSQAGEEGSSGRKALAVGVAAVGVFLWWGAHGGGYAPTEWYPGAVVVLALLWASAVFVGTAKAMNEWTTRAIALLAAFTAWSFASILWAGVRGDAWDGANRTLLYLTVFSLFAFLGWRARDGAVVLGLFAFGTAVVGAAQLFGDGTSAFVDGRFTAPTGYANATAALFLIAFWPAVGLATSTEVHWVARSTLLAAAGVLLQLAILAQSRGSVIAGCVALAVYIALSPQRLRAVLMLVPVGAVTLATLDPLLSVFASGNEGSLHEAVAREQRALALSAAALFALGAVIGLAERGGGMRRRRLLARRRRPMVAALAVGAVFAVLGLTGLIAGVAVSEGGGESTGAPSVLRSSRFGGGLGSGRFDMWRVAAQSVTEHPVLGAGADNFAVDYARERDTSGEEPLYPHSLVLRAFSQTGLVGGCLFLGFVAAAVVAALGSRARSDRCGQAVVAAAGAAGAYWLVHGSIDWLWEIPAVAAPAVAFLGLAAGLAQSRTSRAGGAWFRSPAVRCAAVLLGIAACGSYLFPGLAAFELERGVSAWAGAPDRALSDLTWARRLNPLSERSDVVAGTLAKRAGRSGQARTAFEDAVRRNPDDWYAHLQLAVLNAAAGRRLEAANALSRAEALNPLEPTIQAVKADLLANRPVEREIVRRIDGLAVRSPLGRRSVDCQPILGIASSCT
jgi:tetratricopeptide (TPR) repeat protein